jgi:hypothetical protein
MNTITSTAIALAVGASISFGGSLLGGRDHAQVSHQAQVETAADAEAEADVRLQGAAIPRVPCDDASTSLGAVIDAGLGASVK